MKTETYTLLAYAIYVIGVTGATLTVARMIFRHSKVFILKGNGGAEAPANATGSLLRTQFNLTAVAAMLLLLRFADTNTSLINTTRPGSATELFEALSLKLGVMLLVIGALHFLTLRVINRVRTTGEIF